MRSKGSKIRGNGVWALEAFGAAYTLQELLTIKSDDMQGRNETLNAIVKGLPIPRPGIPESFKVLVRELQALCLDVATYKLDVNETSGINAYEINLMGDTQQQQINQFGKILLKILMELRINLILSRRVLHTLKTKICKLN